MWCYKSSWLLLEKWVRVLNSFKRFWLAPFTHLEKNHKSKKIKEILFLFIHQSSAVFSLGSWHLGPVAGLQANIIKTNTKRYSFGSQHVGKVFCLPSSRLANSQCKSDFPICCPFSCVLQDSSSLYTCGVEGALRPLELFPNFLLNSTKDLTCFQSLSPFLVSWELVGYRALHRSINPSLHTLYSYQGLIVKETNGIFHLGLQCQIRWWTSCFSALVMCYTIFELGQESYRHVQNLGK